MAIHPNPPGMKKQRRSIRLSQYDYGQPGSYFITFCTNNRACILSSILDGKITLLPIGKIVEEEILRTQTIRENVTIDAFVIMPNHVHLLVTILREDSLETQSGHFYRQSFSIPSIVAAAESGGYKKVYEREAYRRNGPVAKKLFRTRYS